MRDTSEINEKLLKHGMLTVEQQLEQFSKYEVHVAMNSMDFFEEWLHNRAIQYIAMTSQHKLDQIENGAEYKDNGIEDFILGKSSAFREIYISYHAAKNGEQKK